MPSIPWEILNRLRKTFIRCDKFFSHREMRAIFIDSRIELWRIKLPEASNLEERVNWLIDELSDRYNNQGENALVLFLEALADRYESQDQSGQRDELYGILRKLANDWKRYISLIRKVNHAYAEIQPRQEEYERDLDSIESDKDKLKKRREKIKESSCRIWKLWEDYKNASGSLRYPEEISDKLKKIEHWCKDQNGDKSSDDKKTCWMITLILVGIAFYWGWSPHGSTAIVNKDAINYRNIPLPTQYLQDDISFAHHEFPIADIPHTTTLMGGVPFAFNSRGTFLKTQTEGLQSLPTQLAIPVGLSQAKAVYLLLNLSDARDDVAKQDQVVGNIQLVFDSGDRETKVLKVGQNVREWVIGIDSDPNRSHGCVTTLSATNVVKQVWSSDFNGKWLTAIDLFIFEVPKKYAYQTLTHIIITDTSLELGNLAPGIQVFGITVTYE